MESPNYPQKSVFTLQTNQITFQTCYFASQTRVSRSRQNTAGVNAPLFLMDQ